jgi:hypothetical protein
MTRKAEISFARASSRRDVLFDGTMCANIVLANGCMSYLTPADARGSPRPARLPQRIDPVEQYFRICTEIVGMELARSIFTLKSMNSMDQDASGQYLLREGRRNLLISVSSTLVIQSC